ncbi:MAG: purine/pyrimidine permease [Alistipes sp.]|nr:purine/pyrimidine permease [Alistipes sp.]
MKLRYGVDERPGLGATLLYGLQWLMICIPVVLTSTFIAPAGEVVCFTQKLFAAMGVTMIVQALWGHRLPLVAGPAAVLLMGVVASASQGHAPQSIYPAMIVGGAIITLLALSGLLRHLLPIFTPRIVVAIVVLISFTMSKPIVGMIFSDTAHQGTALLFALLCVGAMAVANNLLRGIWKSMVVIVAMILGALIYYCFTGFPTQLATDTATPTLLLKDMSLDAGVVLAFCFCYIALLINEVGSVQALGDMVEAPDMAGRQKRGMVITGIVNMLCGATGIPGAVDYSLSPGVVASTSCASRYTIIPAAVAMIILSLCPPAVAFLLTIPTPVMGTVLLYLMATQVAAGLHMMQESKASATFMDALILAIPIMFTVIMSFAPQSAIAAIPSLLRPIVGNSFVMGIIIILLLEHVLLRKKR